MIRWDRDAAAHLLRRAGFGASRTRLDRAVLAGLDATVDELLAHREHDERLTRGVRSVLAVEKIEPLAAWWMALILRDRAPLVERVSLMWHDHFATSWDKVQDTRLMHAQVQLFREKGLGDFRELLHAVATDPAMLVWLDGTANKKGNPNENFAREVLELFALGIGNYGERDIQEAARAFSGWGVDGRSFVFRTQHHDEGTKELFGRRAAYDGHGALDAILAQPACPVHVAHKLLEEFVQPEPSGADVEEWARVLVDEDWSIGRTLARLFRSELFFSPAVRRSRIASPVELVAITAVTFELSVPPADAARAAADMGQSLFRPPSVKGWDGGRTWIHAGSWLARHNRLAALADDEARTPELARAIGDPEGVAEVVPALLKLVFPEGVTAPFRETVQRAATAAGGRDDALRRVAALVLTAPEYHLV